MGPIRYISKEIIFSKESLEHVQSFKPASILATGG